MDLGDDDEFGDLYTDVLRPISAPPPPAPAPALPSNPITNSPLRSDDEEDDQILSGNLLSVHPPSIPHPPPPQTLASDPQEADGDEDWILGPAPITEEQPLDWNEEEEEEEDGVLAGNSICRGSDFPEEDVSRTQAVDNEAAAAAAEGEDDGIRVSEGEGATLPGAGPGEKSGMDDGIGDLEDGQVIPGLSVGPSIPGAFHGMNVGVAEASKSDDWDSDSGDDLQIVLNDDNLGRHGTDRSGVAGSDDDDGEDDLVIVTDGDQHHLHQQTMEEQEWGEESMQPTLEGEKKEMSEVAKGSTGIGAVAGTRVGYGGHGFHPQHHSHFKYVRPVSGGAAVGAGAPGQVRPPLSMGPMAGRGRGMQRGFHPGYGMPNWANNNSARPFGSGLEFTLPSHKTIFDVDIDGFEEKPWKHPGVDISDFFNFGLDEDSWKDYCKQLEQLRLEATMQTKIRVYESGRSEQEYDPDLPPELAAATGLQEVSAENAHVRIMDGGQSDLHGQGRGSTQIRPQLPTGRAIQVEGGYGERQPSIDTRPPRQRDSDAIIEIVLQNSFEDTITCNGAPEQPGNDAPADGFKGEGYKDEENDFSEDSKYNDHFPTHNGRRESESRKMRSAHSNVAEGDGILPFPPEAPMNYNTSSKIRSPSLPGGALVTSHASRQAPGISHESGEYSGDTVSGKSDKMGRYIRKEKSEDNIEASKTSETPPAAAVRTPRETSVEDGDDEHYDRLALAESTEAEGEEVASDLRISGDTPDDNSSPYSVKKQKVNSEVEQPTVNDSGDARTGFIENARAKSGSSKDNVKHGEGGEDEVMQDVRFRRSVDLRRHHDDNRHGFQRRDEYGRGIRHEIERNRIPPKGREDLHYSHLHRELDSNPVHHAHKNDASERPTDRGSAGNWHGRDDDVHGRRIKDESIKQEHMEETGSRQRSKVRVSEKKGDEEDLHSRERADDGYWRAHHDREGGPRQRERDDTLINRHENIVDAQTKRRKDEEHHRREIVSKEALHGYRSREDTGRSKRERDDSSDRRRKEDPVRGKNKTEDHHSARHRDENLRHREKEDRQRLKQAHDDIHVHREREDGRTTIRGSRVLENKSYGGSGRTKDDLKGFNSDKESLLRRRHKEPSKRGDRIAGETHSQDKGHKETHTHEAQFSSEGKSYRNGRPTSHGNNNLHALDSKHMNREKNRENSRSRETQVEQNSMVAGKRRHEENSNRRNVKIHKISPSNEGTRGANGQETNNIHSAVTSKKAHQHEDRKSQARHEEYIKNEEKTASDDENQQESRRGRSKLERWTSHKERDYISNSIQSLSSSLRVKEVNDNNVDMLQSAELVGNEMNKAADLANKGASTVQISDREEADRHLETVEKLKKRSERFKLPMPGEDTTVSKKVENDISVDQSDSVADSEIKQERPARKRRWVSS